MKEKIGSFKITGIVYPIEKFHDNFEAFIFKSYNLV